MKKIISKSLLAILSLLFFYPQIFANNILRDTVSVANFGLRANSRENAVPYIQQALEECRKFENPILIFPQGRYDFWPHQCIERDYFESNTTDNNPKRLAVLIENFDNLIVDGLDSDFVFHDRIQPFTADNSRNIIIRNFSVDWDIPLTAQAVVESVSDDFIELRINPTESPFIIDGNGKLVFVGEAWSSRWWGTIEFDRETRLVVPRSGDYVLGSGWHNYNAESVGNGIVRLHYAFERKPEAGNLLVMRHSSRDHAGVFITESRDVKLENINMYHNAGLGVLAQFSENLNYRNVNNIPNEKKGRILAGHDDGFHFSNCKGEIVVSHCAFHALMDDPVNVHGTSVKVEEVQGSAKLKCRFVHHESVGMKWARPGEEIGFIAHATMHTFARGKVKSFRKIDKELFEIEFEEAVPSQLVVGDALENLTWTPSVLIADSYIKSCRARGILVSTPGKIVIENNIFESSGSAILIAGDANRWYETGGVRDVTIKNNIFKAPCLSSLYQFCEGVISICPEIPQIDTSLPGFHRNITISGNEFHLFDYPVLYALSVDGIAFCDNLLVRSYYMQPYHYRKHGLTFEACRDVTVSGNRSEGDVQGLNIAWPETSRKELKISKKSIFTVEKQSGSNK